MITTNQLVVIFGIHVTLTKTYSIVYSRYRNNGRDWQTRII